MNPIRHRIVLAGCGDMANVWIQYALKRSNCSIVGLVDIRIEAARELAAKYGLDCDVYEDLAQAIRETGATLVFDTTTPSSHHLVATTAMLNGCDVLSEKPLASSLENGRSILETSKRTGRSHSVMQNHRYTPSIQALRDLIASGTIGKPGYAGVDYFMGPHFGGFRAIMDNPLLLDMAIHTFDQARKILDANPVSVYCHEFNPVGSWYAGNASAICIFEMSNGVVFVYRGSWCAEGASTSWEGEWRITGEKGSAVWNGIHPPYAEVAVTENGRIRHHRIDPELPKLANTHHHGCLDAMFEALEQGRPAETNCHDNIYSLMMVLGAIESARTGEKVRIDEWIAPALQGSL